MESKVKINSLETLDEFILEQDNAKSTIYFSDIPESCKTEKCMIGGKKFGINFFVVKWKLSETLITVDEAGRGPVLSSMVYGIAFCPISQKQILKDLGCADSKVLSEADREKIFVNANQEELSVANIGWAVDLISPTEISTSMYRRVKRSLNEVSMESAIALVKKAIELGVNVAELYVDTVGPPEKYQAKLKAIFPRVKVTVAKKADSTYPIVSLASICAKVSRDHVLHTWKFREEVEIPEKGYGSGYPGDAVTRKFLEDNVDKVFGFPRIVRFSWSTAEKILEDHAYPMRFEEEDDDKEKPTFSGKKMTAFFKADVTAVKKQKRHHFWKDRCLEDVENF